MPTRRPPEDEDDTPRPKHRKKRKRKKDAGRPILLFVLLGVIIVAGLATGAILLVRSNSHREREPGGGSAAGRPGARSGGAVGGELVTNGSFEDGPEPDPTGPGFTPVEAGAATIPGWAVTRGSVDYIGPYWQHADGRRSVDLNGNEPGAIAQTLRTRPGAKYRVTFRLSGNGCGGDNPAKVVAVSAAGGRAEFTIDMTGRTYEAMGWETRTWEFTATAAETPLEFASATDAPPACGPALDWVSVVEVGG